ncbi:hypothetical protein SLA2020_520790 [Shorea laevis]
MKSNGAVTAAELGLKKGPWTASEDAILMDYVRRHGEGNWNSVQKNSGLMRCGKSCRLRWANHLRPNLKKGSFSPEEERLIIELHAKLGNKWARMAAQLPGRTDNEIKNYWNTRMKRRLRAGLPIYPQEVRGEAAPFNLQQSQQEQRFQQYPGRKRLSSSLSSFLTSPSQHQRPESNSSVLDGMNFASVTPVNSWLQTAALGSSSYSNPSCQQFGFNDAAFALPLSSVSPFGSSSNLSPYDPNFPGQLPAPLFQFNSGNSEPGLNYSSLLMGAGIEPVDFGPGLKTELPSSQTPPRPTTPASSSNDSVCFNNIASSNNGYHEFDPEMPSGNSGLLDDLLLESQALSRKNGSCDQEGLPAAKADKGKRIVGAEEEEEEEKYGNELCGDDSGGATAENQTTNDLSSSQSSIGIKRSATEEHLEMEEMNPMDDDLLSLLNNFPSSMPLPAWYNGGSSSTSMSNGSSSGVAVAGGEAVARGGPEQSGLSGPELNWTLGSRCWHNMPGIR